MSRQLFILLRSVAAATLVVGALAGPAEADFSVDMFDGDVSLAGGAPATQAGSHPYSASTEFRFPTHLNDQGTTRVDGHVKNIRVDLPAGFVVDPNATTRCNDAQFQATLTCPTGSQIGIVKVTFDGFSPGEVGYSLTKPVYNMQPPGGKPALFAFEITQTIQHVEGQVRPGDHGITALLPNLPTIAPVVGSRLTLWGVPADPSHDAQRGSDYGCVNEFCFGGGHAAEIEAKPLVTNPTSCTAPGVGLPTFFAADSYEEPGVFKTASFTSHLPAPDDNVLQGPEGCERLEFRPSSDITPTSPVADTPTGLDTDLRFGQNPAPNSLATAHLRKVVVTLPDGLTISPGAANGLSACTDAQLDLDTNDPVACPSSSAIGTVQATTPLLAETLSGSAYIRTQNSDDPESGEMFRLALVLESAERGIRVKLTGSAQANTQTGRLRVTFDNNPQLPVDHVGLTLKSGPRAPLVTPASCSDQTIDNELTSWSGATASRPNTFGLTCTPATGQFSPSLAAGVTSTRGGAYSPFTLTMSKPDGNAAVNGLRLDLPTGLLARLKGNLGTRVGSATAFAGSGSSPFALPGQVYLEGAYGDASFSLRVVVPAKAGPFDLGEVTVRQKIYVDPTDAHVTVISDPLPTIVKGVPVRLQRLDVNVDKPEFIINPTSCAAKTISGTLNSAVGQTAPITNHFQVSDCGSLALKPSLALSLSGKGQTRDGAHPAISAVLTQPAGGQANLKKVEVSLPLSLALDPDNADGLCEFVDGSKTEPTCPKASIVGTASAVSPILNEPLSGPVYFVKNERKDAKSGRSIKTLPKLVIPLVGENGVKLTLTGTSNVVNDRLVTTFDNIPDAPVSSFKLNIIGGKGGILTVSGADICKATQIADQQVDGQNNKQADADVFIQTPSCPLKVISKRVDKTSVAVKIGGLGAGKVTVTGKGIRKTTKTIAKSTVATIITRRTKGTPGKVTVSFDPTGSAKGRKTTT